MRSLFLFLVVLFPFIGQAQVISIASGDWENPLTWDCNCIPASGLGQITIDSDHTVAITTTVTHDDIVIQPDGILTIANGGRLILEASLVQLEADPPTNPNDAEFTIESGGILENLGVVESLPGSMIFENGAEYQHNQQNGAIPLATWQTGSTCRITGWAGTNANSTFRATLAQSFHHFIWDNPGQTVGNVTFSGFLSTVNGNLIIYNTNGNRMVSLGGNNTTLNVGGDFIVNGLGRVSVAVSGGLTFTMNVLGDCLLSSTTGVSNYQIGGSGALGITNLNVTGDLILDSGEINLAPAAGAGNVNVTGNIELNGGSIIKPGAGTGNVSFAGAGNHDLEIGSGTFTAGNLTVAGGTLSITGNPLAMGGNVTVQNGAILNLPSTLATTGSLQFVSGSTINSNNGTITLNGSTLAQTINANGATLHNITIDKSIDAASVTLTSSLLVTGQLNIISANAGTVLNSAGNLTLLSTSDGATGNAQIGPLLNTASVNGSVTVQRFMSSEDRIYRYISSPVTNAPVSQLQDDFPITGSFTGNNNGGCTGCSSSASMFFYNAALGLGQYAQFPVSANTEQLAPGRGYAAFIRQDVVPLPGVGPVTFDLTGPINQGDVSLPVFHNALSAESWNLVGNPYPSSIDWDDASWTKTNIAVPIAVRDAGAGMFQYWDGANGGITDGVIASEQGFWVRTTSASPQLTVRENAKSTTNGAFFRTAGEEVITVNLTKGSLYDKTYFQLVDGAAMGLDDFDAPKMVNDNFDLSTRFGTAQLFAINSVNEVACGTELFLDVRFTKTATNTFVINPVGAYELSFDIAGSEFDKYIISLVDKFTDTRLDVTSGFSYSLNVTDDPASLASDRLKLLFEGKLPSLSLAVEGPAVLCGDNVTSVIVKNSDQKFEYFLVNGDQTVSPEQTGTGGDLTFNIVGSQLHSGSNLVKVGVKGVCGIEFLTQAWPVNRYADAMITVEAGDVLVSNYATGNQWYFNEELISGANSQTLRVIESGKYTVEVMAGECTSRADLDYAVTGLESKRIDVSVYPNPFNDKVYLTSKDLFNPATKISILNNLGQQVYDQTELSREGEGTGSFSLGKVPDGIYFIRINLPTGVDVRKILKYTP